LFSNEQHTKTQLSGPPSPKQKKNVLILGDQQHSVFVCFSFENNQKIIVTIYFYICLTPGSILKIFLVSNISILICFISCVVRSHRHSPGVGANSKFGDHLIAVVVELQLFLQCIVLHAVFCALQFSVASQTP
jgi:hypothetical protein